MQQSMIRCEGLKKSFGQQLILENASFTIPDGELVGLYGRSGSGKSTLSKLLCGVYPPDDGEIYLDNVLLCSGKTPYERRHGLKIQMVYQQPYSALDPRQKLGSGFYELIRYHRIAPDKKAAAAKIEALLAEVGLERDILSRLPSRISGGEAQRISIARCLLFEPRLLILDEATSMLDVSTQANVLALVRRLMEKHNGSVLLISHDRELVEYICSRIYVLEHHCIRED